MTDSRRQGLHRKYRVQRSDGRDKPGDKHGDCQYFVLGLTHEPLARLAAAHYAEVAEHDGWLLLAADLRRRVEHERVRSIQSAQKGDLDDGR